MILKQLSTIPINLSILDFKVKKSREQKGISVTINLSILDFKER